MHVIKCLAYSARYMRMRKARFEHVDGTATAMGALLLRRFLVAVITSYVIRLTNQHIAIIYFIGSISDFRNIIKYQIRDYNNVRIFSKII